MSGHSLAHIVLVSCKAVLFDLDGVLVESRASVERQWVLWAGEHGVDMARIRALMDGVRGAEVVAAVAPELDAEAEAAAIDHAQAVDLDGVEPIEGAVELVAAVPEWTVVTSGRRELASARLGHAGIPVPDSIVCAEDVTQGKPDPEGYLLAATRLGVAPADCVVIEDAPPGVAAAGAAGARVVAVTTTHSAGELEGADVVTASLKGVRAVPGGLEVLAAEFWPR
jgi:mannitol-1-/sugar-/sorbitol-6-phosphatase